MNTKTLILSMVMSLVVSACGSSSSNNPNKSKDSGGNLKIYKQVREDPEVAQFVSK